MLHRQAVCTKPIAFPFAGARLRCNRLQNCASYPPPGTSVDLCLKLIACQACLVWLTARHLLRNLDGCAATVVQSDGVVVDDASAHLSEHVWSVHKQVHPALSL